VRRLQAGAQEQEQKAESGFHVGYFPGAKAETIVAIVFGGLAEGVGEDRYRDVAHLTLYSDIYIKTLRMAKNDALQGSLDLLVLKILSRRLASTVTQSWLPLRRVGRSLRAEEGSLYPHSIDGGSRLDTRRVDQEGHRPPRPHLRVTAAGKKQLGAEESRWQSVSLASTGFCGRHEMSMWSRIQCHAGERLNREIEEELQAHMDEAIAWDRSAEARALRLHWRAREAGHSIRVAGRLESLVADVRFGWRQLWRNKITSLAAVLSLALGIGSCVAVFI